MIAKFTKAEIKCAFWEWMPKQQFFAVDFGENDKEREETIEAMWRRFVDILLNVAEVD